MKHLLNKTLLTSGALASLLLSASLVSCQDEDYGFTSNEVRAAAYDRNFIAKYGEIAPDQNWDLSKYAVQTFPETRAMPDLNNCAFDRISDASINTHVALDIENEWYYVEPHLLEAFNYNLGEGLDNTKQGTTDFEFVSTGAPFYIVPLFQGISGLETELHMEVTYDGHVYDKEIWTKGQNLQKQVYGSLEWVNIAEKTDTYSNYHNKAEYEAIYNGSSFGAKATRSKPIRCIVPAGATIRMYVHVTKGRLATGVNTQNGNEAHDNNLAYTGVKQYSDEGKMISLSESLFNIPESAKRFGKHAMIIGCEDASYGTETVTVYRGDGSSGTKVAPNKEFEGAKVDSWNGDNDMNDLVFMFVYDDLDLKEKDVIRKRYLIEDLGSVADWDFNDIVVDVYQRKENGVVVEQKAMIRQKCGTTDFDILFKKNGNYSNSIFGTQPGRVRDSKSDSNWQSPMPEVTSGNEITLVDLSTKMINGEWPWDPAENNIVVRVYPATNNIDESKPNIPNGDGNYPSSGTINSDDWQNGVATDNSTTTNQQMADRGILVTFPKYGQVPRIIAVDTDFPWTDENQDIDGNLWSFTTITVNAKNVDAGVGSGGGKYRVGSKATIRGIANPGYKFKQWSDGNTEEEREVTVAANATYTAEFKEFTSVEGKNYDIIVNVDGNGTIGGWGAENQTAPYRFSFISIKQDGTPNDDGFYIQAKPDTGNKFLYWSDENGNIETSNPYYVKSTATLTAHFIEDNSKKPLVIRFDHDDWTNWDHTNHPLSLHVKDGNTIQQLTINDKGEATYYATNNEVTVVANSLNNNQWDIVYEWSQGQGSYSYNSDGSTQTHYGGTSSLTRDVRNNIEQDIISIFNSIDEEVKKTLSTAPLTNANGNIVTVGITSQVLANYALRQNNQIGNPQNINNVDYGTAKINGDARQVFLHKNSSFNLIANANPGYHFVGWYRSVDNGNNTYTHTLVSTEAITRNQINNSADGQYFITAVFEMNPTHTLKINLTDANHWSNNVTVKANGRTATKSGDGSYYTVPVAEGADIKLTIQHNSYAANDNKDNVKYTINGTTISNGVESSIGQTMSNSDKEINATLLYRVYANRLRAVGSGNTYSSYSTSEWDAGNVTITYNGNEYKNEAWIPYQGEVTINAVAYEGEFVFKYWTGNYYTDASRKLQVDGPKFPSAAFVETDRMQGIYCNKTLNHNVAYTLTDTSKFKRGLSGTRSTLVFELSGYTGGVISLWIPNYENPATNGQNLVPQLNTGYKFNYFSDKSYYVSFQLTADEITKIKNGTNMVVQHYNSDNTSSTLNLIQIFIVQN